MRSGLMFVDASGAVISTWVRAAELSEGFVAGLRPKVS
jgi:hypothetical protein